MRIKPRRPSLLFIALATLLLAANTTWAQEDTAPKKRLRNPATARGTIGDESHDSYVIRARKGPLLGANVSLKKSKRRAVPKLLAFFVASDFPAHVRSRPYFV